MNIIPAREGSPLTLAHPGRPDTSTAPALEEALSAPLDGVGKPVFGMPGFSGLLAIVP